MKKNKKFRFNILDVVVIIILLSLIVFSYLKTNHREISLINVDSVNGTVVFKFNYIVDELVPEDFVDKEIFIHDTDEKIGIVKDIELVTSDDNEKCYLLYAESPIKTGDRGYYISGKYYIAAGRTLDIKINDNFVVGCIVDSINLN